MKGWYGPSPSLVDHPHFLWRWPCGLGSAPPPPRVVWYWLRGWVRHGWHELGVATCDRRQGGVGTLKAHACSTDKFKLFKDCHVRGLMPARAKPKPTPKTTPLGTQPAEPPPQKGRVHTIASQEGDGDRGPGTHLGKKNLVSARRGPSVHDTQKNTFRVQLVRPPAFHQGGLG